MKFTQPRLFLVGLNISHHYSLPGMELAFCESTEKADYAVESTLTDNEVRFRFGNCDHTESRHFLALEDRSLLFSPG